MYLIGYDIGTSSIKATLLDAATGAVKASAISPKKEMVIIAHHPGWAEQDPQCWWDNLKAATAEMLAKAKVAASDIKAVGISYQMHGLVCVDRQLAAIRPSIIWCDSRAVAIGEKAAAKLGENQCLEHLLNLPGNFTAAKLKWVMDNEPHNYKKIYKVMLPGDYIAAKLTGKAATTASGLSEGMFWDFKNKTAAKFLIEHFGFSPDMLSELVPTFGVQGTLTKQAAEELGLKAGTAISYRAGDQPNNAFSLNVLNPGEIAATAGTSGVVYGIGDKSNYDLKSRVNTFAHVNSTGETPRYGVLLCVNGTGILNSWLKHTIGGGKDVPSGTVDARKVISGFEPPNATWNKHWTYVMVKDPNRTFQSLWKEKGYIDMIPAKFEDFTMVSDHRLSKVCTFIDPKAFSHPVNKSRPYLKAARKRGEKMAGEFTIPKKLKGEPDGLVPVMLNLGEKLYVATTDFGPCAHCWSNIHPDNEEYAVINENSAVPLDLVIAKPPVEAKYAKGLIPPKGSADMTTDWFYRGTQIVRLPLLQGLFKG